MRHAVTFLFCWFALFAGTVSAQPTAPPAAPLTKVGVWSTLTNQIVGTNFTLNQSNAWPTFSNWFHTNFTGAGANDSAAMSNWFATNRTGQANGAYGLTNGSNTNFIYQHTNVWPMFTNWLHTNNSINTTNFLPQARQELKSNFNDLKNLFNGQTNAP